MIKGLIVATALMAALGGLLWFYVWRFNGKIRQEKKTLLSNNTVIEQIIDEETTKNLPAPVKRWLENSGIMGKEKIHTVQLNQRGVMRLQPDQEQWMEAEAEQLFTIDKPGFIWKVRTSMAGIPVIGRDLFVDGQGSMEIRLVGTFPMVKVSNNKKINESTLQRFLGEIVWFPSAALSPYIKWEHVDEHSAKAIMSYGGTTGSAVYHFNDQGDLVKFTAPRYKDIIDAAPTDWVATVMDTQVVNGLRIPTRLEAAWLLEKGPFTWYKFEIFDVVYNQSD